MQSHYPRSKTHIIGAGIIGFLEAYYIYLQAKEKGEQARITMHEKNKVITDTTSTRIRPSLTIDEIMAVVPRGNELIEKLKLLFNSLGGIRVDDVPGVDSDVAHAFQEAVKKYGEDKLGHEARTTKLLELGRKSMELWQTLYDTADLELKEIFEASNFNPCREPHNQNKTLHDGYRIDLIYNYAGAKDKASAMKLEYEKYGYTHCQLLTPDEVEKLDPSLKDFCKANSIIDENNQRIWKNDAIALWRPGGCINIEAFLPKFYAYLQKKMGTYIDANGKTKDCLQLRFDRKVDAVEYTNNECNHIQGLRFFNNEQIKRDKHQYENSSYVFCPGSVGTLKKLDFMEPQYAGFAGASLILNIQIPSERLAEFEDELNHCMEVHQEGVVLAWQAKKVGNLISIGVAGTKSFYADQQPNVNEEFALDRNLLQLNMINDVLPKIISLALGRDTKGQKLTQEDLQTLVDKGIAKRWVGVRAVAYDGFPTLGRLYNKDGNVIDNARVTTHLGSGGVSFGPAVVQASRAANAVENDELTTDVLKYGNSCRRP